MTKLQTAEQYIKAEAKRITKKSPQDIERVEKGLEAFLSGVRARRTGPLKLATPLEVVLALDFDPPISPYSPWYPVTSTLCEYSTRVPFKKLGFELAKRLIQEEKEQDMRAKRQKEQGKRQRRLGRKQ